MPKKIKTVEEILAEKYKKKIPVDKLMPNVPELPQPKVSIFNRTWAFLDKKKTVIGFIAETAGTFLIGGKVGAILQIVGALFGSVGVTHKAEKVLNKATSGEKIQWGKIIQKILNFFKTLLKKG